MANFSVQRASVSFCAASGGFVGPDLVGRLARLDRVLLRRGVALLGRGHQRGIDDLPAHGEIAALLELAVEVGEQHVERTRLGQLLAEQPDRVGIGRRRAKIEAEEAQPAQPVPDQILHPRVGYIVLRRQHQHLEHRHRIIGRATALRPVSHRPAQRPAPGGKPQSR